MSDHTRADEGEGREPGQMTMQTTDQVAGEAREKLDEVVDLIVKAMPFVETSFGTPLRCLTNATPRELAEQITAALRAQPERGAEDKWTRSGKSVHYANNMGVEHEWINPKLGAQMFPQGYDPNLGRSGPTIVHQGHTFTLCPGDTAVMADGTIYGPAKDEGGGR